jgi:two-component system osmolarity sensor histidine kinase EnvZ
MKRFLKRITPKSILAKILLIFILPTIISQSVIIYIFIFNKSQYSEYRMAVNTANQILIIKDNIRNSRLFPEITDLTGIKFFLRDNKKSSDLFNFKQSHKNRVINNFVNISSRNGLEILEIHYNPEEKLITMTTPHEKGLMVVQLSKRKIFNPRNNIFIYWILSITFLMSIIAITFTRNQLKSIFNLVKAVDKFDVIENDMNNFIPSGPKEIRTLGVSFLKMVRRIEKNMEEKKLFLSAISHDLRTPLSRIKLSLEMMNQSTEVLDLKQDTRDMEQMINQHLSYCAQNNNVIMEELYLEEIESLVKKRYKEKNITIRSNVKKENIMGNLVSINRIIDNLTNNSLRYGQNILISLNVQKKRFLLTVEDDGVGIDEDKFSEIIKPFYRIDDSRNLDSKNIGLGLAIVDKIAKEHEALITFGKSDELGGLKVAIKFAIS